MWAVLLLGFLICGFIFLAILGFRQEAEKRANMSSDELQAYKDELQADSMRFAHGPLNDQMICPHCQKQGFVHTKKTSKKKGISGAKATGAVLTAGISVLATGLSKSEDCTEAFCENCKQTWYY